MGFRGPQAVERHTGHGARFPGRFLSMARPAHRLKIHRAVIVAPADVVHVGGEGAAASGAHAAGPTASATTATAVTTQDARPDGLPVPRKMLRTVGRLPHGETVVIT
jgi:hypothetical protein